MPALAISSMNCKACRWSSSSSKTAKVSMSTFGWTSINACLISYHLQVKTLQPDTKKWTRTNPHPMLNIIHVGPCRYLISWWDCRRRFINKKEIDDVRVSWELVSVMSLIFYGILFIKYYARYLLLTFELEFWNHSIHNFYRYFTPPRLISTIISTLCPSPRFNL